MNIYHQILTKYWGYTRFRPLQEDIISSIMAGNDTLALMPTGGGKSLTFQVPAMSQDGICIVITPLIALMKDQVENLAKIGIKAIAIYSGMTKDEIDIALDNCVYGDFKFLYCSPERLGTEIFRVRVVKMNVNLIAVDEAHCISQWGYDFRPSYLKISDIRAFLPDVPILALTATATKDVANDIQEKLKFKKNNLLQKSFERKNLVYLVRETDDKLSYLLRIITIIKGSGIVYARNRAKTKEIAQFLLKNGIKADFYHAGLSNELRTLKQDDWKTGRKHVMVSTNAFGMGIDKPDVRFVVHMDLPDTLEAYFQEAGRAGRDEKKAWAVLLYSNADKLNLEKRVATNFPEIKLIKTIYEALSNFFQIPIGGGKFQSFDFNIATFASAYKMNILLIHAALKILEQEGYIELTDDINNPSKIHFIEQRDDLYKFQVANASFDGFIKLILRSYSGLFTEFVNIDEESIARKASISREKVFDYLNKLSSLKIIKYIPRRKNPVVVYTEERLDEKTLYISPENYNRRKENYLNKLDAVINYASSTNKCRSQLLLMYFGETGSYRCGTCDVCTRRNELDLSNYEFDMILEKIKGTLSNKPVKLETIINQSSKLFDEDKAIKVTQWLLDNNKIAYTEDKLLVWVT